MKRMFFDVSHSLANKVNHYQLLGLKLVRVTEAVYGI